MKRKKLLFTILRTLLSFAILFFLFYRIGFTSILDQFTRIKPIVLIILFFSFTLSLLLEAVNYFILLKALDKKIRFNRLFTYSFFAYLITIIMPGKLGQFSIAYFLSKEKIPLGTGVSLTLIDKMISFVVLSIFSVIGVYLFFNHQNAIVLLLITSAIIFAIIILIYSQKVRDFIKKQILKKYSKYFKNFSRDFFFLLKEKKQYISLDFFITIFKWGIAGFQGYYFLTMFGINVSFIVLILISAMSSILSFIPITLSGLGIKQGIGVYLLGTIGVTSSIAMSLQMTLLLIPYIVIIIIYLFNIKKVITFKME